MSQPARANPSSIRTLTAGLESVIALRGEGHGPEAIALCEELARQAPQYPDVQHLLGILIFEAGDHAAALTTIGRAIALAPTRADFLNSKGIVCRALGERAQAADAFRQALAIDPNLAEAHNNLGTMKLDAGERDGAIGAFRRAIALQPSYADAALNLARALAQDGAGHAEAIGLFRRLLEHPTFGRAAFEGAVELALRIDTAPVPAWLADQLAKRLMSGAPVTRDIEALCWRIVLTRADDERRFADPFARVVLARGLACSPAAEEAVVALRRRALALSPGERALSENERELMAALALQANLSNHVQAPLPGEAEVVARLRATVEASLAAGETPSVDSLVQLAVFSPLDRLEGVDRLARLPLESWPEAMRPLLRRAVFDPVVERALVPRIQSLGSSDDAASQLVAAQYESHPYPRWIAPETGAKRPLGALLRDHLPAGDVPRQLDGPVDLLIAGCGTGWSVVHAASSYASARIIGLDLSRASLAYGLREVIARRLENVAMVQGDLLQLGRLGRRFDYIVSGGVLHHMADPIAGWRVLVGCLKPHGLMQIGLYSTLGRRAVVEARARFEASHGPIGPDTSDDAIRAFRAEGLAEGASGPLAALLRYADFYDLHGCRDLVFNVVEHRFDLQLVEAALHALGLEFLGFNLPSTAAAQLYLRHFPDDPSMRSLPNWHRLETEHRDLFAAMYQFWCRRKPSQAEQAI